MGNVPLSSPWKLLFIKTRYISEDSEEEPVSATQGQLWKNRLNKPQIETRMRKEKAIGRPFFWIFINSKKNSKL